MMKGLFSAIETYRRAVARVLSPFIDTYDKDYIARERAWGLTRGPKSRRDLAPLVPASSFEPSLTKPLPVSGCLVDEDVGRPNEYSSYIELRSKIPLQNSQTSTDIHADDPVFPRALGCYEPPCFGVNDVSAPINCGLQKEVCDDETTTTPAITLVQSTDIGCLHPWIDSLWSLPNVAIPISYLLIGFNTQLIRTPLTLYFLTCLNASSADVNVLYTMMAIPVCLKMVFALVSDVRPIFGRRRVPYLVISWLLFVSTNFAIAAFFGPDEPWAVVGETQRALQEEEEGDGGGGGDDSSVSPYYDANGDAAVTTEDEGTTVGDDGLQQEDMREALKRWRVILLAVAALVLTAFLVAADVMTDSLILEREAFIEKTREDSDSRRASLLRRKQNRAKKTKDDDLRTKRGVSAVFSTIVASLGFRSSEGATGPRKEGIQRELLSIPSDQSSQGFDQAGTQKKLEETGDLQTKGYISRMLGAVLGSAAGALLFNNSGSAGIGIYLSIRTIFFLNGVVPLLLFFPLAPFLIELTVPPIKRFTVKQHFKAIFAFVQLRAVWQPMAFVYIFNAAQLANASWMSYLITGLQFKAYEIGILGVMASLLTLAGVMQYKTHFIDNVTGYSWRKVFFYSCAFNFFFGFLQVLLVLEIPQFLGIPRLLFAMGDDGVQEFLMTVQFLPLCGIYLALCPEGAEGTTYALLTTFSNLANIVSFDISTWLTFKFPTSPEIIQSGVYVGVLTIGIVSLLAGPIPLILIGLIPKNKHQEVKLAEDKRPSRIGGCMFLLAAVGTLVSSLLGAGYALTDAAAA